MRILLPGNVRVQIPHYLRYSKVETSVCTVLTLVWRINTTNNQETTFVIRCSVDRIVYNGTNIINGYTRFVCVVNIKATTINIVNRSPFTISLFTIYTCVCVYWLFASSVMRAWPVILTAVVTSFQSMIIIFYPKTIAK